jgi:2,5-diamino-6-(ribosylamino)-4(3H)-pyrimidinone 5'-phosphate reductase
MSARPGTGGSSGRPYVHVNCAVSADGRLAFADGLRARLSGAGDLKRVQELRAAADAILVGVGTVLKDDPSLRVHWELLERHEGRDPLRVILDSTGRTPATARVLHGGQPTLVATAAGCTRTFPKPVEQVALGEGRVDLARLLAELARRGVRQLLVEGGATVIASFVHAGFVDTLTVYTAPLLIGGTTAPPLMAGGETHTETEATPLVLGKIRRLGEGVLLEWRLKKSG